ncbi:hypothetical protein D354_01738 [Enterococcus faecalis]|nr:hypothetical protein D354_01738 [Enterococcus faecalis]EPI34177.1 hypothetical protein D351_00492 [Enterococcus faecalis WKS-26-18-2]
MTWVRKNQKLKRKSVACKKKQLQTALKILKNKKSRNRSDQPYRYYNIKGAI